MSIIGVSGSLSNTLMVAITGSDVRVVTQDLLNYINDGYKVETCTTQNSNIVVFMLKKNFK